MQLGYLVLNNIGGNEKLLLMDFFSYLLLKINTSKSAVLYTTNHNQNFKCEESIDLLILEDLGKHW
jgi:hypothetical protein